MEDISAMVSGLVADASSMTADAMAATESVLYAVWVSGEGLVLDNGELMPHLTYTIAISCAFGALVLCWYYFRAQIVTMCNEAKEKVTAVMPFLQDDEKARQEKEDAEMRKLFMDDAEPAKKSAPKKMSTPKKTSKSPARSSKSPAAKKSTTPKKSPMKKN
jgi:hypothetical protein